MDPGIPLLNLEVAYADFKKLLKEERTIHAGEAFGMYEKNKAYNPPSAQPKYQFPDTYSHLALPVLNYLVPRYRLVFPS